MRRKARVPSNKKYDRQAIFEFIIRYKTENDGQAPTLRNICQEFEIPSLSNAHFILKELQDAGKIVIDKRRARGIIVPGGRWTYTTGGTNG